MDALATARLLAGIAFFAFAAVSDVRTRRVRDPVWIALGTLGLALVIAEIVLDGADAGRLALVAGTAVLFYAVFFGDPLFAEDGFHMKPTRIAAYVGAMALVFAAIAWVLAKEGSLPEAFVKLLPMPILVLVYQGLYQLNVIHGGADAKALIALTLLLPTYPDASPFPLLAADPRVAPVLRLAFPFSLVVWVDAAVLFLAVPLAYLVFNAVRGDLAFPQAFLGYRADLERFPAHAWPMERIEANGEHVLVLFPKRGGDVGVQLAGLRTAGVTRAWVQPKIPFMVPLLLGFVGAFFVGNLLLLILPR